VDQRVIGEIKYYAVT